MPSAVQTLAKKEEQIVGKPLVRMEDPKFITGSGTYIGDVVLPGMLHARFVRSTYAHARILSVDASKALGVKGVRLVLTASDLKELPEVPSVESSDEYKATHRYLLVREEANFVGEPIAMVVADSPSAAQLGTELVDVEYEPLPAVVDLEKALEKGSPKVHAYLKDNLAYRTEKSFGNLKKAFEAADHVVKATLEFPRLNAVPLEPRDIIASYDGATGVLTAWAASQSPHEMRTDLASMLKLSQGMVRVIVPDMGGGFGQKGFYPEYAAVCFASMKLEKPVKWVETRAENFLSASMGRGQKQFVEAAVTRDGKILGLKVKVLCDGGAYSDWAISMPETTMLMSPGVYDIGAFHGEALTAFTNKTPIGAYRGASRPEAAYLIERTVNVIAKELKLDPVKVRLKNYVPKKKFPFDSAGGFTYDSGDYEGNMKAALKFSKYDEMLRFQRVARSRGRLVGVAAITYVEVCGFGSGYPQTASVTVTEEGVVIITSGTSPHGQGHWTPFAQIVADELGIEPGGIVFRAGDTNSLPWSTVTAGSRSAVVGGSAVLIAARRVKEKMSRIAAKMLGSGARKIVFADGKIYAEGSSGKKLTFEEVAGAAYRPKKLPQGMEASLYEYCAFAPPNNVFPFGTHVAMVEVDKETGKVKVLKYVAVDDVGKVLNPLIVEGQVQGGAMQGISQALLEEVAYDENGQLLTQTLFDYLIPSAEFAPNVECYRTETPSPANPLGVKGVGEAGTIAATPAIANAVEDALAPFGATVVKLPLSPAYVWSLMQTGRKSRAGA